MGHATHALRAGPLARVARVLLGSKPYGCGHSFDPDFPVLFSEVAFVAWPLSFLEIARHHGLLCTGDQSSAPSRRSSSHQGSRGQQISQNGVSNVTDLVDAIRRTTFRAAIRRD